MLSSAQLKQITTEARPIIERQLEDAERLAGLRDVVAAAGGDWGQLKALIKAQIRDEQDEAGEGKHVRKILDKADYANAYAGMLGLANMNEKNFSDDTPHDADGVVIEDDNLIPAFLSPAQPNGADPRTPAGAAAVGETANHSGVEPDDRDGGNERASVNHITPSVPVNQSEPATLAPQEIAEPGDDSAAPPSAAVVVPELASVDADAGVDRSGSHRAPLNAPAPVATDYTKPNPWCQDPEDCGVNASWNHMCGSCLRLKNERQAAGAVQ